MEVNESEILNIIDKLKNTNSSGIDKISNKAIKFIKNLIATPLALIINQSLMLGSFPDKLKIAKIRPLLKRTTLLLLLITNLYYYFLSFLKYLKKLFINNF